MLLYYTPLGKILLSFNSTFFLAGTNVSTAKPLPEHSTAIQPSIELIDTFNY